MSCNIRAKIRNGEIVEVEGAGCKRGIDYCVKEIRSPVRDFFTTIRVKDGKTPLLSVRSTEPVSKNILMACATELSKLIVPAPVRIGDVIVRNILHSGIDIIATKDVEKV